MNTSIQPSTPFIDKVDVRENMPDSNLIVLTVAEHDTSMSLALDRSVWQQIADGLGALDVVGRAPAQVAATS